LQLCNYLYETYCKIMDKLISLSGSLIQAVFMQPSSQLLTFPMQD
jgi:hypothetical protein